MKKKWQIMVALVLSLVTLITVGLPALAEDEEPAATDSLNLSRGALAIIAPWTVPVGKEFTVRAFLRENQEPFPGAGVWAINQDTDQALKEELSQLRQDYGPTDEEKDYESILNVHGIFLGRTGGDGRLACTFEQAGKYILVAARNGYLPGCTHITARLTVKALGIQAPKRTPVGEEITIAVFARITQDAVQGAGIWAVTRDNVEVLKQEAQALKDDTSLSDEEKDYEALVDGYGFFLGITDTHGKLEYTFEEAGGYLLVAVKMGYFPGFAPLVVYDMPKALGIKATPPRTHVGKEVTLNVFDRPGHNPVEDAGVWAISRDDAETLQQDIAALKADKVTAGAEKDYEAAISAYGGFLGRTDINGKLSAKFDTAGFYVLVTVKKGYIPGFTTLVVKDIPEPETVKPAGRASLEPLEADQIDIM